MSYEVIGVDEGQFVSIQIAFLFQAFVLVVLKKIQFSSAFIAERYD